MFSLTGTLSLGCEVGGWLWRGCLGGRKRPVPRPLSLLPRHFPVRQEWAVPGASSAGHSGPPGAGQAGGAVWGGPTPSLTHQEHPSPCRRSASESCGSGGRMEVVASRSPAGGGAWYLCPLGAPSAPQEAWPSLLCPNSSHPPTGSPRPTPALGPPGSISVLLCPTGSRALGCLRGAGPVWGGGWWFPGRRAWPRAWGPSHSDPWGWPHALSGLLPVCLLPPRPVALLTPPGGHRPQGEVVTRTTMGTQPLQPRACCHAGRPHPTGPNCSGPPLPYAAAAQAGPGWGPGTTPAGHPHALLHPAPFLCLC